MQNKTNELMVKFNIGDNEIKLTPAIVEEYIVGNSNVKITNQEFKLFTELCKVRQLNPFLREAYLIKYGNNPAQMVVGKDAIYKRAILHPKFNGIKSGIIVINRKGEIETRTGTFFIKGEEIVGGWANVYRKDWEKFTEITVSFEEVAQRKNDGNLNSNWEKKPATMVEKVAKVRALRETFTEELGGMIDEDEVWTNDNNKQTGKSKAVKDNVVVLDEIEVVEEVSKDEFEEIDNDFFDGVIG